MVQLIPRQSLFIISVTLTILLTLFLHVCISAPVKLYNKSIESKFPTAASMKEVNLEDLDIPVRKPSPPIPVPFATTNMKRVHSKKHKTPGVDQTMKLSALYDKPVTFCQEGQVVDHDGEECRNSADLIEYYWSRFYFGNLMKESPQG